MTKFRAFTRSADSSDGDRDAALPVNVIVHNDPAAEYKYLLKPVNDPPQIRVVVPGALDSFCRFIIIIIIIVIIVIIHEFMLRLLQKQHRCITIVHQKH